jgi:hypothetical protein
MCKRILLAGAIALSATAAHAETDYQRTHELAEQIGMLLASEQLCGLTYNQLAVQRFIEQHVDANDLQFSAIAGTLRQLGPPAGAWEHNRLAPDGALYADQAAGD